MFDLNMFVQNSCKMVPRTRFVYIDINKYSEKDTDI